MTQENCDNHFLFRAVSMGLLHQNQEKILDEYLCMIVINDAANAINRGAAIEYFGNDYQIAAHDSYCLDGDLRLGEQVIKILNGRIKANCRMSWINIFHWLKNTCKFIKHGRKMLFQAS